MRLACYPLVTFERLNVGTFNLLTANTIGPLPPCVMNVGTFNVLAPPPRGVEAQPCWAPPSARLLLPHLRPSTYHLHLPLAALTYHPYIIRLRAKTFLICLTFCGHEMGKYLYHGHLGRPRVGYHLSSAWINYKIQLFKYYLSDKRLSALWFP